MVSERLTYYRYISINLTVRVSKSKVFKIWMTNRINAGSKCILIKTKNKK